MPYRLKNIQQLCTAKSKNEEYITKTIDSEKDIQHLQLAKQKKLMLCIDHRLHEFWQLSYKEFKAGHVHIHGKINKVLQSRVLSQNCIPMVSTSK